MCAQSFFLNFPFDERLHVFVIGHEIPGWQIEQQIGTLLPIATAQSLSGVNDEVSRVFWWSSEDLSVEVIQQSSIRSADDLSLHIKRICGHVWYF